MPPDVPTRRLSEAALLAGCSPRTLRRYVALGLVGAQRVGGRRGALCFTDQDIEDAISVRTTRLEKTA